MHWRRRRLSNKSAQSNLGRGPRLGAVVAHVYNYVVKSPLVTMARRQNTPSHGPIPFLILDPSDLRCQKASGSDRRFSTMHWTDRPTDGRTQAYMYARIGTADRSSTGKFDDYRSLRYTRATRPKNDSVIEILWLFFHIEVAELLDRSS